MQCGAMQTWRPREIRRTVRIGVRVRTEAGWTNATVRNLSERGMMLDSPHPLPRNQFVEIARGRCRVVGRIVWSDDAACGLRAQDAIDIAGLLSGPQAASAQRENDRRAGDRAARPAPADAMAAHPDRARRIGRALQFGVVLAGIACAATIAVGSVLEVLGSPLEQIGTALAPG